MDPGLAMYHLLTLVGGLGLLIFGAELLVRGAARLARAVGISSFIVGLTVVAFGTSAPELGGSLRAALEGDPGLAVGNVVGSNIANICLILGVTALICPIPVKLAVVRKEAIIMLVVTIASVLLMLGGGAHRVEGGLLVLGLLAFVTRAYREGRRAAESDEEASELAKAAKELEDELSSSRNSGVAMSVLFVVAGLAMLYFGSGWLVEGASALAGMAGVSSAVIGLSVVAFGTSVPELTLSAVAAFRKQPDIAIGNIVGSNIFNLLCVLGITALASPTRLPPTEDFWTRDAPIMIAVTVLCLPIMIGGGRVSRGEGALLLGLYGGYLALLILTSG